MGIFTRVTKLRMVGGIAGAAAIAAMLVVPATAANAETAHPTAVPATSCTDGAMTMTDITEYGTDIQLRMSPNCGGSVWFRLNGWNGEGSGTISMQVEDQFGNVSTAESAINQESPYISPYVTGDSYARIVFTNEAGYEPDYTGPWEPIYINAIARQ